MWDKSVGNEIFCLFFKKSENVLFSFKFFKISFCFFRVSRNMYLYLVWNLLCGPDWPWTHWKLVCLCFPSAGIKGMCHQVWYSLIIILFFWVPNFQWTSSFATLNIISQYLLVLTDNDRSPLKNYWGIFMWCLLL